MYLYVYVTYIHLHGVYVRHWKLYEILCTVKVLVHHLWCFYENQIYDERIIVSLLHSVCVLYKYSIMVCIQKYLLDDIASVNLFVRSCTEIRLMIDRKK